MAGRSEDIEALLKSIEELVAQTYAQAAYDTLKEAEGKSGDARMKAAADAAKAGRAVKLFRGSAKRLSRAFEGLQRVASDTDDQETVMNDDDARWTPDRIAELHAKVRERLAKFAGSRELKAMVERDLARSDRAMPADPAVPGGPSAPAK